MSATLSCCQGRRSGDVDMASSTTPRGAGPGRWRTGLAGCLLVGAALLLATLFLVAPAVADDGLLSAEQILAALEQRPPLPAKGFLPKANPDAATRVCDADLNRRLLAKSGQRGELLTRNLYVEAAPTVDLDIAFAYGEAALLAAGRVQLDELARALLDPGLRTQQFVFAGHTDVDGGADYNDRLSCERALSARRYLVVQHGIDADRLVPMGFGFEKLKDPLQPRAAVNRRVEIRRFAGLQKTGQP
jgi:outer membrane protein OmpA-like peptidoglycan-associated protein